MNDATRLFGAALGVAVIGSVAASLYGHRLAARLPHGLPARAVTAARSSLGGALVAARSLQHTALAPVGRSLTVAADGAFLHSMAGSLRVAGAIALAGAVMAAVLLPSRPGAARPEAPDEEATEEEPERALVLADA
jgi:DHA2 family multidrug resistance protein-like MFS transporter